MPFANVTHKSLESAEKFFIDCEFMKEDFS
jgi:hypothetical protein